MSKLTLDEAIKHCLEVAEENETKALRIGRQYEGTLLDREAKECRKCAADHRQLAEWLRELKEAKRLLRLAVDDFDTMHNHIWDCTDCKSCPLNKGELGICGQEWRFADEAEKLIES